MIVNDPFRGLEIAQIEGDKNAFLAFFLHHGFRLFGIVYFFWEVNDGDITTFSSKENRDTSSDSRTFCVRIELGRGILLATGDDGLLVLQLVGATVFFKTIRTFKSCGL